MVVGFDLLDMVESAGDQRWRYPKWRQILSKLINELRCTEEDIGPISARDRKENEFCLELYPQRSVNSSIQSGSAAKQRKTRKIYNLGMTSIRIFRIKDLEVE
jgi:hypothetical protein